MACISAQGLIPVRFAEPHDAVQVAVLGTYGQFSYDGTLQWCAVRISGAVVCWAATDNAGGGTLFTVPGISDATKVAVGKGQSCVLEASGDVSCWPTILDYGSSDEGPCVNLHDPPQRVSGIAPLIDLSVGADDACGVDRVGNLTCWTGPASTYRLIEIE